MVSEVAVSTGASPKVGSQLLPTQEEKGSKVCIAFRQQVVPEGACRSLNYSGPVCVARNKSRLLKDIRNIYLMLNATLSPMSHPNLKG